jgi:hypothetical protein
MNKRLIATVVGCACLTMATAADELGQHKANHLVDHGFMRVTAHQFAPSLHQPQLQHLRLGRDVCSVGLRARRLLPLAPLVSQVGNAALVEREAVTLPLEHAIGFELAEVGPAAIEVLRQFRALTVAGFLDRARETGLATDWRSIAAAS